MFLLKLCEEHIQGIPATSRKKIETYIWGDVDVDRKTNLNQLVCTLRKKLGNLTSDSVVITQPKKGYSLDDCIVVKQHDPSAENEEKIEEALITSQSFLNKANSFLSVFFSKYLINLMFWIFLIMVSGYSYTLSKELNIANMQGKVIINESGSIVSAISNGVSITCIKKDGNRTKFSNYMFLGMKEADISDDWRKKICEKL